MAAPSSAVVEDTPTATVPTATTTADHASSTPAGLRLRPGKAIDASLAPANGTGKEQEIDTPPPSSPVSESNGSEESAEEEEFDPSAPPPFTLADLRNAIPARLWVKHTSWSMAYFFADWSATIALAVMTYLADHWLVWFLYWNFQGMMFSALFVIGHDCDHGSFSDSKLLNDIIGHICHTPVLTPFHGWRISHRHHHSNHGHVENDESWHPISKQMYDNLNWGWRLIRYTFPIPLFIFPVYLWVREPGKSGSHFNPKTDVFQPKEATEVLTSAACWFAMLGVYAYLTFHHPTLMWNMFWIPYINHITLLAASTYMHHHGHTIKLPWYRGEEWNYLRGALTTVDRDSGLLKIYGHDIGTHVVHHLFPQIPHYHLVEATEFVKPVLGKYYREPEKTSFPLPWHLAPSMLKSFAEDHFVAGEGDVVFYQKDPKVWTSWYWWGK